MNLKIIQKNFINKKMKNFIDKYAEQIGGASTIIPALYWVSVWFEFSKADFLFIFLLPLSTFIWIWTIGAELKTRKEHPEEKKIFFLLTPIAFLIFSVVSTIHIYYR